MRHLAVGDDDARGASRSLHGRHGIGAGGGNGDACRQAGRSTFQGIRQTRRGPARRGERSCRANRSAARCPIRRIPTTPSKRPAEDCHLQGVERDGAAVRTLALRRQVVNAMPRAWPWRARTSMSRCSGAGRQRRRARGGGRGAAPAGVAAVRNAIRPSRSSVSATTSKVPVRRARLDSLSRDSEIRAVGATVHPAEEEAIAACERAVEVHAQADADRRAASRRAATSESMESIASAAPADGAVDALVRVSSAFDQADRPAHIDAAVVRREIGVDHASAKQRAEAGRQPRRSRW